MPNGMRVKDRNKRKTNKRHVDGGEQKKEGKVEYKRTEKRNEEEEEKSKKVKRGKK